MFELVRFPNKNFRMRMINRAGDYVYKAKDMPKILYRLPNVLEATTVFVTEGERDADRLHGLKLRDDAGNEIVGTTNANGAGKWKAAHTKSLKGKKLILIGDNDERGISHMDDVEEEVTKVAKAVARVHIPTPFKDVSEYLEMHSVHNFISLMPENWLEELVAI